MSVHSSHFANMQELVYYFYLAFNCPHLEAFCKIVDSKEIVGLPPTLTSTVIRKHYPHQDIIRAQAQLSKRPIPNHPEQHYTLSFSGEQVELDVLMISTPTSSMPRANGGYRHVLLVVDVYSSCLSYVPIKSMSNPTRFVESVVTMYQNNGHPIKLLKMDH